MGRGRVTKGEQERRMRFLLEFIFIFRYATRHQLFEFGRSIIGLVNISTHPTGGMFDGLGEGIFCVISGFILVISIPAAIFSKIAVNNKHDAINSRIIIYTIVLIIAVILILLSIAGQTGLFY